MKFIIIDSLCQSPIKLKLKMDNSDSDLLINTINIKLKTSSAKGKIFPKVQFRKSPFALRQMYQKTLKCTYILEVLHLPIIY